MIVGSVGAGPIRMGQPAAGVVAEVPNESTTLQEALKDPAVFGVPVIAPVEVLSTSGGGREPLVFEKVRGGVPPVTIRAEL